MSTSVILQYSFLGILAVGGVLVYGLALREKIRKANGMDTPADQVPVPADFHKGRQLTYMGPAEGQKPWIKLGESKRKSDSDDYWWYYQDH